MSIQSEIDRIKGNVIRSLAKIAAKGVTVPDGANSDNLEALIEAIQAGLPSWIKEMHVQTFKPEVDTNEERTFSIEMENVPNMIIVMSDQKEQEKLRDFLGCILRNLDSATYTGYFPGYMFYTNTGNIVHNVANSQADTANTPVTTWSGVGSVTNKSFVFRTHYYGGQYCYWRAAHTYTIIALKV